MPSNRAPVSKAVRIPSPVKGWHVGADIADAPPGTAYILDNAFPQVDFIRVRGGATSYATGIPGSPVVSSLMVWTNGGTWKMFAGVPGAIYDVSNPGSVGAAAVSGLSGGSNFQGIQFKGLSGTYLIAVNGVDAPQVFNGSAWNQTYSFTGNLSSGTNTILSVSSIANLAPGQVITGAGIPAGTTIASAIGTTVTMSANATSNGTGVSVKAYQVSPISGVTDSALSYVWSFKNRLYFIAASSMHVWYLGLDAIGGAATMLDLSSIFPLGGKLLCGAQWSVETSQGLWETCVFVTSMGEVAVYAGGWPGDSGWTLVGTYRISIPVGPNCLMKAGGDLAIMTQDGIISMSQAQTLDQAALQNVAITAPIGPAWVAAVQARLGLSGWSITPWPFQSMAIICLPKVNSNDFTQFVANTRTGAWCRYIGWDANSFAVMNNALYFGASSGNVMQAETGGLDNGVPYTVTVFPAFSELGAGVNRKDVKMVRPMVQANFVLNQQVTINTDFNLNLPVPPSASSGVLGSSFWDSSLWDMAIWPPIMLQQSNWLGAFGYGSDISPIWQITVSSTATPNVQLSAIDVLAEIGSAIG